MNPERSAAAYSDDPAVHRAVEKAALRAFGFRGFKVATFRGRATIDVNCDDGQIVFFQTDTSDVSLFEFSKLEEAFKNAAKTMPGLAYVSEREYNQITKLSALMSWLYGELNTWTGHVVQFEIAAS